MCIAAHQFLARDADSATLETMIERSELPWHNGAPKCGAPRIGDEVKLLFDIPTDVDDEVTPEWNDSRATIAKVGEGRVLVHSEFREKADWFEAKHEHQAQRAYGYSTPHVTAAWLTMTGRQPGRCDHTSTVACSMQASLIRASTRFGCACILIHARPSFATQRLPKALLPMF